jgi:hypothetical protein
VLTISGFWGVCSELRLAPPLVLLWRPACTHACPRYRDCLLFGRADLGTPTRSLAKGEGKIPSVGEGSRLSSESSIRSQRFWYQRSLPRAVKRHATLNKHGLVHVCAPQIELNERGRRVPDCASGAPSGFAAAWQIQSSAKSAIGIDDPGNPYFANASSSVAVACSASIVMATRCAKTRRGARWPSLSPQ